MKHEIDKIVRNTLYDYSASAPDDVWNSIQNQLNNKKFRIAPVYWKSLAASIALLISFGGGYFLSTNRINNFKPIAHAKLNFYHKVNSNALKPVFVSRKGIKIIQASKGNLFIADGQSNLVVQQREHTENIMIKGVSVVQLSQFEMPVVLNINGNSQKKSYSPQELFAMQNAHFAKETNSKSEVLESKWAIGGQFTPNYSYREMKNNTSEMPSEYYNSVEKAILTYSGGLSVNLNVSKRITIESGINYALLGQSSNLLYAQLNPEKGSAYEVATSAGVITPQPSSIHQISGEYNYVDPAGNIINTDAELIQNFSYFEIPLNAKIKLIDKKLGFSVISGLSTDVLIGNKVFFKEDNEKLYIGQTENLNEIRYSTNFRLGFDYKMGKQLSLNFEPGFKYSLVPINKNDEIDNYSYTFGLNTGLVFKF